MVEVVNNKSWSWGLSFMKVLTCILLVLSPQELTHSVRVELAGLKEDGIDHPNLDDFFHPHFDLFLINRHFACKCTVN